MNSVKTFNVALHNYGLSGNTYKHAIFSSQLDIGKFLAQF